jgi:hypothetical protein
MSGQHFPPAALVLDKSSGHPRYVRAVQSFRPATLRTTTNTIFTHFFRSFSHCCMCQEHAILLVTATTHCDYVFAPQIKPQHVPLPHFDSRDYLRIFWQRETP